MCRSTSHSSSMSASWKRFSRSRRARLSDDRATRNIIRQLLALGVEHDPVRPQEVRALKSHAAAMPPRSQFSALELPSNRGGVLLAIYNAPAADPDSNVGSGWGCSQN